MGKAQKPWEHAKSGGSEHNAAAARFVESLSYDTRMYKQDIRGSIAHARMLKQVDLLDEEELQAIEQGLGEIEQEIESAQVTGWAGWCVELEDVHMCIEAALIEKIGEPGRKLHTGRSRNDQVALDLKLWIRDAVTTLDDLLAGLQCEFVKLADCDGRQLMLSYTHLQRAQPIVLGGELLAWVAALQRARDRLGALVGVDQTNPLGSGAIAGSSLPLDRRHTSAALGFAEPSINSMDATASRDAALDFVYSLSMVGMTLSRWAEQWIIYMSSEFGFLSIGDDYTTGSSMMPQKRNPDMLELIRGRCGNLYGHLTALLTICKGITIGYNRDLQEDKRHVFAAYDLVHDALIIARGIVATAEFDEQRISANIDRGFADATILAEYLVTRGMAFRTAHQVVGKLVRLCGDQSVDSLSALSLDQMQQVSGRIGADVYQWLGCRQVVARYRSAGNCGLSGLDEQLKHWHQVLSID